jgi:hypothetical protein
LQSSDAQLLVAHCETIELFQAYRAAWSWVNLRQVMLACPIGRVGADPFSAGQDATG